MDTFVCYRQLVDRKHHPILSALSQLRDEIGQEEGKMDFDKNEAYLIGAISLLAHLSKKIQPVTCGVRTLELPHSPVFFLLGSDRNTPSLLCDTLQTLMVHTRELCRWAAQRFHQYFVYLVHEILEKKCEKPPKVVVKHLSDTIYLFIAMGEHCHPNAKDLNKFQLWKETCMAYLNALKLINYFTDLSAPIEKTESPSLLDLCWLAHEASTTIERYHKELLDTGSPRLSDIHHILSYLYFQSNGLIKEAWLALDLVKLADLEFHLVESFELLKSELLEIMNEMQITVAKKEKLPSDSIVYCKNNRRRVLTINFSSYLAGQVALYEFN